MTTDAAEVFAIDLATLAREIAMDIFPLEQILELHKLSNDEWETICANAKFKQMIEQMAREWNATTSTAERVRTKAQTGLETQLEIYVRDIADASIPLAQRVEAGKFLARLGELDGQRGTIAGAAGGGVVINIISGKDRPTVTIEATPVTSSQQALHATQGVLPDEA